jgi:hypothetical protein
MTTTKRYGLTSDGSVTTNNGDVAVVDGHKTTYALTAADGWEMRVDGPGGAEMACQPEDVPAAIIAVVQGEFDGIEDVETVLEEQGRDVVIATLAPGHVAWDEGAINAGAAKLVGIPDEHHEAYYAAYARAARARAEEIEASA